KDMHYRVILFDTEGMSNTYRSPKPYRVEAIEDRQPDISIQQPPSDVEVTANAELPIKAVVKDDFGNTAFSLHYQRVSSEQPGEEHVVSLGTLPQPEKLSQINYQWALESLKLAQGNVVRFRLDATDSKTPTPNVGKSREIHLRVVNKDDFLQRLENEQQ